MFATLEIDFNCMVVFVPDERAPGVGTIHALMPDTSAHGHADATDHPDNHTGGHTNAGNPVDLHVVRIYHRGVHPGSKGIDMTGWALDFSGRMADTTLTPLKPSPDGAEVVNLSTLSAGRVPRDILNAGVGRLAARVSAGYGATLTTMAEATWRFGTRKIRMAHRLVWRMEGLPADAPLPWSPLPWRTRAGADPLIHPAPAVPIRTLSEFGPDRDNVYRISIFHVPEDTLPPKPNDPPLDPPTVRKHFKALYGLVGVTNPTDDMLPAPDGIGGKVNCGLAQALFA